VKCLNCGGTDFEYTNWFDEKTQRVMYQCNSCFHLYITKEILIDVTDKNDIGNILMGRDIEASLRRIENIYRPLDKLKKELEEDGA